MVEPSPRDLSHTVVVGDGSLSKETSHHATDHTTDGVGGENIETVVNSDVKLDLGSKVASETTDESDSKRRRGTDVSSGGSDGDETRDGTGAEPDGGPLSLQSPIEQHPGDTTDGSSQVGNDACLDGSEVGRESRSTVESKPTEPEEDCTEDNVRGVVGLVGESLGTVTSSLTEVCGNGQVGSSGRDMDGRSTGKVETSEFVGPSVRVPGPACDWTVHDGHPNEDEDANGSRSCSLGETTNGKGGGNELRRQQ